jgi:probable phosphoglycerate mutase
VQLLLIRHASNDWLDKRLPGWAPGVHLDELGRLQAAALSARLADHPIEAVFASPLDRAVETAAFVAGPHDLAVRILEDVGELRCGTWEGRELAELRSDPLWPHLQQYPSGTALPGGETLTDVQFRAVKALEGLRTAGWNCVAVVSHADVIRSLVAHYLGVPLDLCRRLQVSPASLTVIRLADRGPQLVLLNDTGKPPLDAASVTRSSAPSSGAPGAHGAPDSPAPPDAVAARGRRP